jgi:response regulator RpfG family c-di-GMP phosphodiesterase
MPKFFNRKFAAIYVDDSPDDHFLFQHSVVRTEIPLHVQPFFSAEPAITYLKGEPPFEDRRVYPSPAFLLCDFDLKISRGSDLISAVRAIPLCEDLPIILFSGSDDKSCVLVSYLAGADFFLCKPTAPGRLDIVVQTLYVCASSEPRSFERLSHLPEYQPRPQAAARSKGPAASAEPPFAASSRSCT